MMKKRVNKIRIKTRFENEELIHLKDILSIVSSDIDINWAILPDFEASYYPGKAQEIVNHIRNNILKEKIIPITWNEVNTMAQGVGQFIDLVLIGCKDEKKLKPYPNDNEMFKACDIVIVMFDTSYWEIGCKDQELMDRFIQKFKYELK